MHIIPFIPRDGLRIKGPNHCHAPPKSSARSRQDQPPDIYPSPQQSSQRPHVFTYTSSRPPDDLLLPIPQRRHRRVRWAFGAYLVDFEGGADVTIAAGASSDGCRGTLAGEDRHGVAAPMSVSVEFAHLRCLLRC